METKEKRGGKKEEPKSGELEFIHECFARGLSNSETLDEMQDEVFPLRELPFIARRRKEFDAVKKVLDKRHEGAYDTDIFKRKKTHWDRLAQRAQEFSDRLKAFFPYTDDYILADAVIENDDYELGTLLDDFRSFCLFSHLKTELTALKNLKSLSELKINDIPQILSTLGLQAEKQQFVGKCEVCKDWE